MIAIWDISIAGRPWGTLATLMAREGRWMINGSKLIRGWRVRDHSHDDQEAGDEVVEHIIEPEMVDLSEKIGGQGEKLGHNATDQEEHHAHGQRDDGDELHKLGNLLLQQTLRQLHRGLQMGKVTEHL